MHAACTSASPLHTQPHLHLRVTHAWTCLSARQSALSPAHALTHASLADHPNLRCVQTFTVHDGNRIVQADDQRVPDPVHQAAEGRQHARDRELPQAKEVADEPISPGDEEGAGQWP